MRQFAPMIVLGTLTVATPASQGPVGEPLGNVEVAAPIVREAPETFSVPIRHEKQDRLHVFMPASCALGPGLDLVIHFHGAPPVIGRALSDTGMSAVFAVENHGIISKDYSSRFAVAGMFDDVVRRVLGLVQRGCPGPDYRPRRIALSAWSAGYAAVASILSDPGAEPRIDAVLLSDGIHSAFLHPQTRELPPGALAPFVRFAREAVAGRRFMGITHSAIPTDEYASTTESTTFLLAQIGVERLVLVPSVPKAGMRLESEARRGNFILEGFAGGDEAAHAAQLHGMWQTLFTPLRHHWETTPAPTTSSAPAVSAPVSVTVEVKGDELCTQVGTHVECRAAK
jgi:hypothetical protein